ncbi:hypothetical protein M1373_02210 [Candidatus Marsarchaeota archaeon]|nr:hypothetical protein [Candidatus Marsarchaeota archaeon]MCL5404833.1 hypothetical protein [Candidatus Marsarchaeota archaeon]
MTLNPKDYDFIKDEKDWDNFLKREKIKDYSKIPVSRAKMSGWVKIAFIFIRIYIIAMLIVIVLGFLHII